MSEENTIITRKWRVPKESMDEHLKIAEERRKEGFPEWYVKDRFNVQLECYEEEIDGDSEEESTEEYTIVTRRFRFSKEDMEELKYYQDKWKAKGVSEDKIKLYYRGFLNTQGRDLDMEYEE